MANKIKDIFRTSNFKTQKGVLIVNEENFSKVNGFKCFSSGHPVPNKNGLLASKFLEKYLQKLKKMILFYFLSLEVALL